MVRKSLQENQINIDNGALHLLREAMEQYMVSILEDANIPILEFNKSKICKKHIALALRLRGPIRLFK